MGEICIVSTNAETNHHTDANSKTSLYSLNNASYLVLVLYSGSCGLGRRGDLQGEGCSEVVSCGEQSVHGCVCVPPFTTQWNLLALGDAASFLFPLAKLGEQCWLASNSGCEHGIYGPICKERTFSSKSSTRFFLGTFKYFEDMRCLGFLLQQSFAFRDLHKDNRFLSGGYCIFIVQHFRRWQIVSLLFVGSRYLFSLVKKKCA